MSRQLGQNIDKDHYSFRQADNFKYLDININANNNMHNEINIKITAAKQYYFTINKLFKATIKSPR